MPVRKAPLALQFAGGIETKIDAKQVPTTQLLDLQNCVFVKGTTLSKRNGYAAYSMAVDGEASLYSDPVGLAERAGELLLFDGHRALSLRESTGTWSDAGQVASVLQSDVSIARTGTDQNNPDHATNGGVTLLAWEDSAGGVWASVIEAATGRILVAAQQVDASGAQPRCLVAGGNLLLLYSIAAQQTLMVSVVVPTSIPSTFTTSQLTGQLSSTAPYWDACTAGGTALASIGPGLLAFANVNGGWTVGYLHPSGIIGSPISGLPSSASFNGGGTDAVTGPVAVTLDKGNGSAVVVLVTVPGIGTLQQVYANFVTPAVLSTRSASFRVANVAHVVQRAACEFASVQVGGNSVLWWAFETSNGTSSRPDLHIVWSGSATVAGVSQAAQSLRGHCLYSRAFADATDVYALLVHSPQFFTYYAMTRLSDPNFGVNGKVVCVARSQPGACPGAGTNALATSVNPVAPDATFASRTHAVCLGDRIQLSGSSGTQFSESGIRLCTYEFDAATAYQTVQLGAGLYLAGALLQHYDGARWAEADFHCAPDVASGTTIGSQTTGGSIADDTYGYKIIYEEIDAQGELHPGAVGVAFNVVVVGGSGTAAVTLALPTYRLTGKTMVRIGVFRSPGNSTGDDVTIPYYRVTGTDVTVQTGNNCYVLNNPSLDTITFVDGMSDATLKTQEPLYTNGGILSNDPITCAGGVIATGGSRLFWTDPSDPNLVNFSQQLRADTAMEASPALSQLTDPYGGAVIALGVMDAVIYALKETAIYGFGGPGPDANPQSASGNAFTPSQLITSDVGCTSPSSVAQSPAGIVFHSGKGIMLLDRSRQVEDIGSAVYAYKDQTVTRATLRPDRHEILFLTDAGATLLWDYQYKQWSQFTNHLGVDAAVVGGIYNYLRNDGRIFAETIGAYSDAGAHIPIRIDTAWIKAAGYLQGFQKVLFLYVLGNFLSDHTLNVRWRTDYQETWSPIWPLNPTADQDPSLYGAGNYGAGTYGGSEPPANSVYQKMIHLNLRCQSIAFRFEDAETIEVFGAAFELSELLLTCGVLGPAFRPGAARSQ